VKLLLLIFPFLLSAIESYTLPSVNITGNSLQTSATEKEIQKSKITLQSTSPYMDQPVINGLQGDKISINIDNIKFSNSLFRSGSNQYYSWIPNEYRQNQIITSSTLNSSLGGAVNVSLGVKESYLNAETNFIGYNLSAAFKDINTTIAINRKVYNDLTTPNGDIENSNYNQTSLYASQKVQDTSFKFLVSDSKDIPRTDKFEQDKYYMYEKQRYYLLSSLSTIDNHKYGINYQRFEEKIDQRNIDKNTDSTNNIYGAYYNYKTRYNKIYSNITIQDNLEDIDYKKAHSTNYLYNIASITAEESIHSLDYIIKITGTYSNMDASGSGLDRNIHGYGIGASYLYFIDDSSDIELSINNSFKFPTITNLAEARNDSVDEISNSNLTSEKALTFNIKYVYDDFTTNIYYKKLADMIIRTKTNIINEDGEYKWQYNNTDNGYITGINISYYRQFTDFKNFSILAYGEYIQGKTDYDYISKLIPISTKLKVEWIKIYVEYLYAPSVKEDRMAEKDKIDFRIKDHNIGYSIVNVGYSYIEKEYRVEGTIENLLDSTGRVYGSSIDFTGTRLKIAISRKF